MLMKHEAKLQKKGIYGQVSVEYYDGQTLPYVDDLVNAIVCSGKPTVSKGELFRVIAPGGSLIIKAGGEWQTTEKPRPSNMDEWNQF